MESLGWKVWKVWALSQTKVCTRGRVYQLNSMLPVLAGLSWCQNSFHGIPAKSCRLPVTAAFCLLGEGDFVPFLQYKSIPTMWLLLLSSALKPVQERSLCVKAKCPLMENLDLEEQHFLPTDQLPSLLPALPGGLPWVANVVSNISTSKFVLRFLSSNLLSLVSEAN